MWWQGIDLVKSTSPDRVTSPKRTPQWPAGHECETPQNTRSNSAPQKSSRPKSAVGSSQRQRKQTRPVSATSLLRGEKLIAWKPYEDEYRRGIENTQVKDTKDTMKRERFLHQNLLSDIDVMADPILFDLKVLHNSAQRARSAASGNRPGTAPPITSTSTPQRRHKRGDHAQQNSAKTDNPSLSEVRDLHKALNDDINRHCGRMHMPVKVIQDNKFKNVVQKIQLLTGTVVLPHAKEEDPPAEESSLGFRKELKALFGNTNKVAKKSFFGAPMAGSEELLSSLAKFLISTASGTMRPSLEAIDVDGNGKYKCMEFCTGMELLGWNGDAEGAWNLLDFNNEGELKLKVLEERLIPYLPPPPDDD